MRLFLSLIALLVYSHPIGETHAQVKKQISPYAEKGYLTFDLKPMGSQDRPLILRTFVPTLGLPQNDVLQNHSKGLSSPKYSPGSGKEATKQYQPIDGIPASIAVNLGKPLSYVWDTTECRLLYAWTDGFLDMKITGVIVIAEEEKGLVMSQGYMVSFLQSNRQASSFH